MSWLAGGPILRSTLALVTRTVDNDIDCLDSHNGDGASQDALKIPNNTDWHYTFASRSGNVQNWITCMAKKRKAPESRA